MANSIDRQIADAERRGSEQLGQDMRATAARYDRESGRIVLELANGCAYAFPVAAVQDLQDASIDDLLLIEVDGMGYNLHWPALDADLYVPALVAGIFGTRAWMTRELARAGGQAKSPAKSAAARSNGAKGGRPRKTAAR